MPKKTPDTPPKARKTSHEAKVKTSIALRPAVLRQAKLLAAARGIDLQDIVEEAMALLLKKDEAKLLELQALADSFVDSPPAKK